MKIEIDKRVFYLILIMVVLALAFLAYKIINTSSHKTLGMVTVEMKTSKGTIVLELDGKQSPVTVENFIKYVNDDYYDGLIFHRVIDGFMIQGGGFEPGLKEKATIYPAIKNEARESWLENKRGTIAMARTNDPDSATSQFFINLIDNDFLNPGGNDFYGYAAFGKVVSGMDVVDAIAKVKTHSVGGFDDVPVEDVVILSANIKK